MFADSNCFYYSPTGDLTNSLQRLYSNNDKKSWDERFFWNQHMLHDLFQCEVSHLLNSRPGRVHSNRTTLEASMMCKNCRSLNSSIVLGLICTPAYTKEYEYTAILRSVQQVTPIPGLYCQWNCFSLTDRKTAHFAAIPRANAFEQKCVPYALIQQSFCSTYLKTCHI